MYDKSLPSANKMFGLIFQRILQPYYSLNIAILKCSVSIGQVYFKIHILILFLYFPISIDKPFK